MIEIIVDNKDINQIVIKTRDNGRYINIREEVKVIHNMAILTEIPDKFYGVKILNMYEVDKNYFNLNQLGENEYYVNYNLGYIFFNSYKDTNTFLVDYQGTGVIYYPASRIITKDRGNYIETLEDIVSKSQEALNGINNVNEIVNKANEMYIKLNTSIKNATALSSFLSNLIKNGELTVSDIENSIKQASLKKDELENTISKTQKSIDDINNAKIQAINSVNSTKDILINDITKQADFKKKELNLIIEDADSEQSVLKSTINESERKNKELETTISNASQHKSDLENDISQASILEQNLDNNITVGSTLKTDLDLSVLNANDNKKKLDKTILNSEEMIKDSDKTIVKLKDMISDTNNKKEELNITIHDSIDKYNSLKETISNADDKNSEIKNTVSNANKINDILGGNIESGSTKINEIDDKILEVKDKLDNISKREEEIDKLEKDRHSNEDARILNEKNRVENEKVRNSNENKRENNFKQMQEIHNQFNSICKEFLSYESYKTGNKVIYNGSTYECIKDNIGVKPTNNEHWHCVVAKGKDGLGSGDMHTSTYDKNGNGIVDNAEKVNGHTVNADVPADAKFTDTNTIYDDKELRQAIEQINMVLGKSTRHHVKRTIKERDDLKDLNQGDICHVTDTKETFIYDTLDTDGNSIATEWIKLSDFNSITSVDWSIIKNKPTKLSQFENDIDFIDEEKLKLKADLVNGKVPLEQLPGSSGGKLARPERIVVLKKNTDIIPIEISEFAHGDTIDVFLNGSKLTKGTQFDISEDGLNIINTSNGELLWETNDEIKIEVYKNMVGEVTKVDGSLIEENTISEKNLNENLINKINNKADLVGGKIPESQLPKLNMNLINDGSISKNKLNSSFLKEVENKVNKIEGKDLSENDFNNDYKSKVDGIEVNANKYIHPSTHDVSMISGLSKLNTSDKSNLVDAINEIVTNVKCIDSNSVKNNIILEGKDFNNIKKTGFYTLKFSKNSPNTSISYWGLAVLNSYDNNYVQQIATEHNSQNIYIRYLTNLTWSEWTQTPTFEQVGDIKDLNTTDKSNIVNAVNEVNNNSVKNTDISNLNKTLEDKASKNHKHSEYESILTSDRKRKITFGTSFPSGGSDGDIYFQYE